MTDSKYPVKKLIWLTEEQATAIRSFRFAARIDSENEAIRQLLELGLAWAEETKEVSVKEKT